MTMIFEIGRIWTLPQLNKESNMRCGVKLNVDNKLSVSYHFFKYFEFVTNSMALK